MEREEIYKLLTELFGTEAGDDTALAAAISAAIKDRDEKNDMKKQRESWKKQSEKLCEIYPLFDLDECLSDRNFFDLLRKGLDVRSAYELKNRDSIIFSLMELAAQEAVSRAAALRCAVPSPCLTLEGTTAPAALSRSKREEIINRVAKGEKIYL